MKAEQIVANLHNRKPLGEIVSYPEKIISVYVVEHHIWSGSERLTDMAQAKRQRQGNRNTVEEYLIDPVRSLLIDVFRKISAPYDPDRRDNPIGQGYWIQAEFGSGKSHLLSFIGALSFGQEDLWNIVNQKEKKAGKGKRESLYQFYEGIKKKSEGEYGGIFVIAETLVGQGGGKIGITDKGKSLVEYLIDAVKDQYHKETGETIALYPTELLANWFLENDLKLLGNDLGKFLNDPKEFDEEKRWTLSEFLEKLQNSKDPGILQDCGKRLWDYYEKRRGGVPTNIIPEDPEPLLKHMVEEIMRKGYSGVLIILDEMSLFMKNRDEYQRASDEKILVTLANRLVHYHNLPVWTICTAQQRIESRMGEKNIIANERLKLVPLLNNEEDYYDIVLSRIRKINNVQLIESFWDDYDKGFTWPGNAGRKKFEKFFPFHPVAIDIMKQLSYQLTTIRTGLDILHESLKTQTKKKSDELITLWALFDDIVKYEEDPSGTTKAIASVKTKWYDEWKAYEIAKKRIDSATKGHLKVYRNRCMKILKTLFLFHIAKMAPHGLSSEEIMNCVMEWKDHDKGQKSDTKDNLGHYEVLLDKIELEISQVTKANNRYLFNPVGGGLDPNDIYNQKRAEAEQSKLLQQHAWEHLLPLDGWEIKTSLATLDLANHVKSIFRGVAPSSDQYITVKWHNREIHGRIFMRNLLDHESKGSLLPSVNSSETGLDFHVFISSSPCENLIKKFTEKQKDARTVFWSPDELTATEKDLLIDFASYREMIAEYKGKDTDEAREIITWVQNKLNGQMGMIYKIVPDSYARGHISAYKHSSIGFNCRGELENILTPIISIVLNSIYKSKEIDFISAPSPFNDNEGIKVINGIVKVGRIDKNAKKDKNYSAAQNFGYAIGVMKKPKDKELDFAGNEFINAIRDWIDDKLDTFTDYMPVETIYKNFTGLNGPDGIHYGLSKRMIQIFLLCLVQEGMIKISLRGKSAVLEYIDITNISDIDFKASILDGFERIYKVKAPEGWNVIAPFAQILLEEDFSQVRQDVDIRNVTNRIAKHKEENEATVRTLVNNLDDLFSYLKMSNPLKETLDCWIQFLSTKVEFSDPIPYIRNDIEKAFGYDVYSSDKVKQEDLDDFKSRLRELDNAKKFAVYSPQIKTVYQYALLSIPDDPGLSSLKNKVNGLKQPLKRIGDYIDNETGLRSHILDPGEELIRSYSSRFLQAYDGVVKAVGEAREALEHLKQGREITALKAIYSVEQLSGDIIAVENQMAQIEEELFSCPLTRQEIENKLQSSPIIDDCDLKLENAGQLIDIAEHSVDNSRNILRGKLKEKSRLLFSDSLKSRLRQGQDDPFIREMLECLNVNSLVDVLIDRLGDNPDLVDIIKRYLKKINVRKLRIADFQPSKKTIEINDVNEVVGEFRSFLIGSLETAEEDELPIVEFE